MAIPTLQPTNTVDTSENHNNEAENWYKASATYNAQTGNKRTANNSL